MITRTIQPGNQKENCYDKGMIVTLTGANAYQIRQEMQQRISCFLTEHGDMGLERIDGEEADYQRIHEALTSLPFLASKKLVVLRTPGAQKKFADSFADLVPAIPETTDVIIHEPKLDKRGNYYKALKKHTELIECTELDGPGLVRWLVASAKQEGAELRPGEAMHLIELLGTNQQLLASELAKLTSYDPRITRQHIDLLVEPMPQSNIFMLLDAAFAGNAKRALELYEDQRRQRVEPLAILAMIAWQLHIFAIVKTAGERSPETIAKEAKLNPYVVKKSQAAIRRISFGQLQEWIRALTDLDTRLKSQSIDADEALANQILRFAI